MPSPRPYLALLIAFLLLSPGLAFAQAKAPKPGSPVDGKRDWVKLVSGEWLAGKLKSMRAEKLEFDSDKLDLLQLDWEDVGEVHSPRKLTYALTEKRVAVGPASLQDSVLRVVEDGKTREFPMADLLSIIEGSGGESSLWSGKMSLGFVARSGNTDQTDFNMLANLRRDATATRLDLRYAGNQGELSGVRSVNNQLGSARVDAFLTRNLFVTPFSLELFSDEFQNIDLRTSVSAGAGYFFVRRKSSVVHQAGAGYLSTQYLSVGTGEDGTDTGGALMPSTAVEWTLVKDVDLDVNYSSIIPLPETEKLFHHFVALLTIENLRIVDLTTSITWDHAARPRALEDGSVPDKDDFRTSVGFGIDF
jgi:hypothetical protein